MPMDKAVITTEGYEIRFEGEQRYYKIRTRPAVVRKIEHVEDIHRFLIDARELMKYNSKLRQEIGVFWESLNDVEG
jgi:hypothetical protein